MKVEVGGLFGLLILIADIWAIDVALAVLERGEVLGMYPEGTRSRSVKMLPFLKGAAWLALRTAAPIVPCAITGTERDRRPGALLPVGGADLGAASKPRLNTARGRRYDYCHRASSRRVTGTR
jgi:hypothetical protein